jgi:hypothetical protein
VQSASQVCRLHVKSGRMQTLLVGLAKQSTNHYTAHEDAD